MQELARDPACFKPDVARQDTGRRQTVQWKESGWISLQAFRKRGGRYEVGDIEVALSRPSQQRTDTSQDTAYRQYPERRDTCQLAAPRPVLRATRDARFFLFQHG